MAATPQTAFELAAAAVTGLDQQLFASAFRALTQITDAAFTEYGSSADDVTALRQRFATWRNALIAS